MRITEAQARRLGIKPISKRSTSKEPTKKKGRTRSPRCEYEENTIEFVIDLANDPRPKERPRHGIDRNNLSSAFLASRGSVSTFMGMISKNLSRTYTPQGTLDYEKKIAEYAKIAMIGKKMLTCPVETEIIFILQGEDNTWPTSRLDGDADNLEKAVLDALNGIVFEDDKLVVRSVREKRCGPKPAVMIRVSPARP